jgi:aldehyde:ferredoxin oxidoreductase
VLDRLRADPADQGRRRPRVEYESAFALGPLVGIDDADDVLAAVARCDELGSTRSPPAARSPGRWRRASRPWLRFGDAAALTARSS